MSRRCDNCDGFVTDAYYRVFSVDGVLPACPECSEKSRGMSRVITNVMNNPDQKDRRTK